MNKKVKSFAKEKNNLPPKEQELDVYEVLSQQQML